MAGCRALCVPELVLACWWVYLCPGVSGFISLGFPVSELMCQPTGVWAAAQGVQGLVPAHWWGGSPKASASPLVGRARSQGLWLQGPGVSVASAGTLVYPARSKALW